MLLGVPIEEDDLALVPSLVRFPNVGQVERGGAEGRVLRYAGHASLVALLDMLRIALIPDIDGQIGALDRGGYMRTLVCFYGLASDYS